MKLKYSWESVDLGNEIILVPVGPGTEQIRGVLKLNPQGMEIVNQLMEDTTEGKIVESLISRYENDHSELEKYVQKVVQQLKDLDFLIA